MKTFSEFINEEDDTKIYYPDGIYISVKLTEETEIAIKEYQAKYLKDKEINEELHCTLIYSNKPHVDEIIPASYLAIGTFQEFSLFGPDKDVLVVEVNSQDLTRRNEELTREHGFISDYDEYKTHITLSYNSKDIDLNSLPAMDFSFGFESESIALLDTEYKGK